MGERRQGEDTGLWGLKEGRWMGRKREEKEGGGVKKQREGSSGDGGDSGRRGECARQR